MDPAKMKVVDLRSELGALGLDTKGNKPALVERLKKALESKTGKDIPDSSILDTSTEDAEEILTPRRPGPASRTRRRSSSRAAATPVKKKIIEEASVIIEQESTSTVEEDSSSQDSTTAEKPDKTTILSKEELISTSQETPESEVKPDVVSQPEAKNPLEVESQPEFENEPKVKSEPVFENEPEVRSEPVVENLVKVKDEPVVESQPEIRNEPVVESQPEVDSQLEVKSEPNAENQSELEVVSQSEAKSDSEDEGQFDIYKIENDDEMELDERSKSPVVKQEKVEEMETNQSESQAREEKPAEVNEDELKSKTEEVHNEMPRKMTEEEEWEEFNKRLQVKEQERLEKELKQTEEDAKTLEEARNNPVKLGRLMRKRAKKSRWSNFYRTVETTNQAIIPPTIEDATTPKIQPLIPPKKDTFKKEPEPEISDDQLTLSWYDSDLQQYIEAPNLISVTPLSEGMFAHTWVGTRATHGVKDGRVCFEVKVGSLVSSTEDNVTNGIRVGWSTSDSPLYLGDEECSWGFENGGEVVSNGEYREYGKKYDEGDVIGAYLDLVSSPSTISYTINGEDLGIAFIIDKTKLEDRAVFPHISTKNYCYKVNFGYENYNFLTKTKTVRHTIQVPIEQVLEEKKAREMEVKKFLEEQKVRQEEKQERIRKEREERRKKRKEERRLDEISDRDHSEEAVSEKKDDGDSQDGQEIEKEKDAADDTDEKMENGEDDSKDKSEPMEAEEQQADDKKPESESQVTEVPSMTEDQVLSGVRLDPRVKTVTRFVVEEVLEGEEASLLPGYTLIAESEVCFGPRRPTLDDEVEVILMIGMPGAGKTYWVNNYIAQHSEKRYTVISMTTLFGQMKVKCKPFRESYEGRWDAMISKCAKSVLKLLELASGRRRNYILDQTNVYPSAQRRKMREFEGYKRIAVVVVPDRPTYEQRQKLREQSEGKEVPDGAIMEMKANFTLPEKCQWIDEVIYTELGEDEAKKIIEEFHKEAKAAGVGREKDKRDRSQSREGPLSKRQRNDDRRGNFREDRRRDFGRDRGGADRWGGARWSRGGGGVRDTRWAPQPRYEMPRDRWGRGNEGYGGPGGPGRDAFRNNRGGPPRPNDRSIDRRPPDRRLDKRNPSAPNAGTWQRGSQMQGGRGGMPSNRGKHDGGNQNAQNANAWNHYNWNQWNNWNQQAGWGNWGNWNNWNSQQQQQPPQQQAQIGNSGNNANPSSGAKGVGKSVATQGGNSSDPNQQQQQQQWSANYQQQWYQWQQWQQQQQQHQQQWPGYNQQGQTGQSTPDQQQLWAQYYQNYGAMNQQPAAGNSAQAAAEKK